MEYSFLMIESNSPCLVIADRVNGRYAIRLADTSGEVFSSAEELLKWITLNWKPGLFQTPAEYFTLIDGIQEELISS